MWISYNKEQIDELLKNKFVVQKTLELQKALDTDTMGEFFEENPDYLQLMMHQASTLDCEIGEEIKPLLYPDNLQYIDPPGTFEGIPDECNG